MAIRGPHSASLMNLAGGLLTPGMVVPPVVQEGLLEVAVWKSDQEELYGSLALEGLGFLKDVYGGTEGGGALPIAESWDRRINNMAGAHAKFSRKHQFGAMAPLNGLALWFAGNDETKQMLLRHYLWAQGKPCDLSQREMRAMPAFIDLFDTVERPLVDPVTKKERWLKPYSANLKSYIDEAKRGVAVSIPSWVPLMGSSAALGTFTVYVRGTIKLADITPATPTVSPNPIKDLADPGVPLVFEGQMYFYDKWDFDSKVAQRLKEPGSTARPGTAEVAVAAVAALVDGVSFDVNSDTVPVTQYSGHAPVF